MDHDRVIASLSARQHAVFTRAQALEAGLSADVIDSRLERGVIETIHRGVYRLAGSPSSFRQDLMAACLAAGTRAVASHRAAAALWSLPNVEPRIELTVPTQRHPSHSGVQLHRVATLDPVDVCRRDGIPVTQLARTMIDLGAVLDQLPFEELLDEVLAQGLLTVGRLERRLESLGRQGRKGASVLEESLRERRGESHSLNPFERRVVRLLVAHGLPAPVTQYMVRLPSGGQRRLDAAYPDARLAIECDSYRYHSSKRGWARDHTRMAELVAMGWRLLPVSSDDVDHRPLLIVGQVSIALSAAVTRATG
jgi:restriction endonuclease-like protein/putative AbiEi antitoxin of type IV toxin-antitoxin system